MSDTSLIKGIVEKMTELKELSEEELFAGVNYAFNTPENKKDLISFIGI